MADKPKGDRDLVRFEPNERVDLPDMKAMQDNGRSEARMLVHNFLFGHGDMGLPEPEPAFVWKPVRDWAATTHSVTDATSNWSKGGSLVPLLVEGLTATAVRVAPVWQDSLFSGQTWGGGLTGAVAGSLLDNGDAELGASAGVEGDDEQILDYNGKPAGIYGLYVRAAFDPGTPGTRLFWNAATEQEDAQAMDTRAIAGWNVTTSFLSGGPPDGASVLVGTVDWDGASIAAVTANQNLLFEGLSSSTDGHSIAGSFAQGWGQDGSSGTNLYGHRSNYRFINGVGCWQDWAAALRSQLADIIGDDDGDGFWGWYTEVPKFAGTGGAAGLAGEHASLLRVRDHIDLGTDPHGSLLTQTDLFISDQFDQGTSGSPTAGAHNVYSTGAHINAGAPGVEIGSDLHFTNASGDVTFQNTSQHLLGYNATAGQTINDGMERYIALGLSLWQPTHDDAPHFGGGAIVPVYYTKDIAADYWGLAQSGGTAWTTYWNSQANDYRLTCNLNSLFPFTGGIDNAARIKEMWFYFFSSPHWASGTYSAAGGISFQRRAMGTSSMGEWTAVKSEIYSAGAGGTVGDINIPPGSSATVPVQIHWDLTAEPDTDWTIGSSTMGSGLEECIMHIRLRGDGGVDGSAPMFLGGIMKVGLGRII